MGKYWVTIGGKRKRTKAGIHHELVKFQSSTKAKAERASRNNARRSALRSGRVHKGDGTVIDHRDSNPLDNRKSNLRVMKRSVNAARHEDSRRKGSKRNKRRWGKT